MRSSERVGDMDARASRRALFRCRHLAHARRPGARSARVAAQRRTRTACVATCSTASRRCAFPPRARSGRRGTYGSSRTWGGALAAECRRKGAGVLLAPTVNLQRYPLGGRNFEMFSEDPHLTSRLAVAYIEGLQRSGVGACVKHFVGNESEHERHTMSSDIDERTLREAYLRPFEAAVREADVWAVMSAYNRLNGTPTSDHALAARRACSATSGAFAGTVISDWGGTRSTVEALPRRSRSRDARAVASARCPRPEGGRAPASCPTRSDVRRRQRRPAHRARRDRRRHGRRRRPTSTPPRSPIERRSESLVLLRNRGVLPLPQGAADRGHRRRAPSPVRSRVAAAPRVTPHRTDLPAGCACAPTQPRHRSSTSSGVGSAGTACRFRRRACSTATSPAPASSCSTSSAAPGSRRPCGRCARCRSTSTATSRESPTRCASRPGSPPRTSPTWQAFTDSDSPRPVRPDLLLDGTLVASTSSAGAAGSTLYGWGSPETVVEVELDGRSSGRGRRRVRPGHRHSARRHARRAHAARPGRSLRARRRGGGRGRVRRGRRRTRRHLGDRGQRPGVVRTARSPGRTRAAVVARNPRTVVVVNAGSPRGVAVGRRGGGHRPRRLPGSAVRASTRRRPVR